MLWHGRAEARAQDHEPERRRHCGAPLLLLLLAFQLLPLPLLQRQHSCHRSALRESKHAIKGTLLFQNLLQHMLRLCPPRRLLLKLGFVHPGWSIQAASGRLAAALLLLLLL